MLFTTLIEMLQINIDTPKIHPVGINYNYCELPNYNFIFD